MSSLGIFFLLVLLSSVAEPLISFLLTDKWLDSVIYLRLFCYALMFDHICAINLNLLYVKGKTNLVLRLEVIKKCLAFLILIISIPFGVLAICLSQVIYTQVAIFINTYYTGKLLNFGYFKQMKDYIPYFIFAHIACLPCYFLQCTDVLHPLLFIPLGCVLSISIYLIILYLSRDRVFNKYLIKELKNRFL